METFGCKRNTHPGRPYRDGAVRINNAAHGRELLRPLHGREGRWEEREAPALQGLRLPPHYPWIHVPGRRLHRREWHLRRVDLRRQVRRREFHQEAHRAWSLVDGECRAGNERVAVLRLHRQDAVARREARGVWTGGGGDGGGVRDRGGGVLKWEDLQDRDRR
ncbi:hypothetical protein AAC387_Pa08g1119 [Persea americana]